MSVCVCVCVCVGRGGGGGLVFWAKTVLKLLLSAVFTHAQNHP